MDLLVKTKAMTEALVCTRLALRLVDRADARARGGVPGAAAGAAAGALAARMLGGGAFPAVAPAAHGAPERRAFVAYNAAAAALLSAAAYGVGAVLDARRAERAVAAERDDEGCAEDDGSGEDGSGEDDAEADASSESDKESDASDSDDAYGGSSDAFSDAIDARAADAASASVASYLACALRGVALDAGPCGEAERTAEGDYGELLRAARRALARAPSVSRARSSAARRARGARAELVDAVSEVWTRAVVEGPPERRAACVSLLAAALPSAYALRDVSLKNNGDVSQPGGARSGLAESAAARWLRPSARALWELKHRDPATTTRLLAALRALASRATAERAPATHEALVAVESELAPFFALAPPPSADPDAPRVPAKLGPFARLPPAARFEAIALLGCLPALSPATIRAVAHAALAPAAAQTQTEEKKRKRNGSGGALDGKKRPTTDDVATRAVDAVAANVAAAPLALSTSFFAAVLTGAPEWDRAERVAGAAARALVDLGDENAWAGAALAWGAVAAARRRARASDTRGAEGRAVYGALRLAAAAAEASAGAGDGPETLAPPDLEEDVPRLLASALTLAREKARGERSAKKTPNREPNRARAEDDEDAEDDEEESLSRSALDGVALRALRAAPRWAAGTFSALAKGLAAVDDDEAVDATRAAALAASRVADFLRAERRKARTRPEAERGDAWKTEHDARDTETNEATNAKAKASAETCVSGLRTAADALVRAGVAGAARAASAARDAARDVQDAFD